MGLWEGEGERGKGRKRDGMGRLGIEVWRLSVYRYI